MANARNSRREKLEKVQKANMYNSKQRNDAILNTADYPDLEFVKLEPDQEYSFDIIPYQVTTKKHPNYDKLKKMDFLEDSVLIVPVHKNIGPLKSAVVCPKIYGNRCEICDEHDIQLDKKREEFKASGKDPKDAWKDDEVKSYRPVRQAFFVIKDKEDGKIKLWKYSAAWSYDNLKKRADRKNVLIGEMIFEDTSIIFTPEPNQFNDKYPGEIKVFDFEKVGKYGYTEEDIENAPKLDKMLITHTSEEISNILWGNNTDDEEPEEDSESNAPPIKEEEPEEEKRSTKEEESEEDSREARRRARRKRSTPKENPSCPNGLTFGDDVDTDDACEDCPVYDACYKAYKDSE